MSLPTVTMQAPTSALYNIIGQSGTEYTSSATGLFTSVLSTDIASLQSAGCSIVGGAWAGLNVPLLSGKNIDGSALAAAASTGKFGSAITLGTSQALVGEAANSSTVTDSMMWEIDLPQSMPADYNPTLNFNVQNVIVASGVVSTHSMTVHAYPVSSTGVQSADIVTGGAQNIPATQGVLSFPTAAGNLQPGQRLVIEVIMENIETAGHNAVAHIFSLNID